MKLSNRILKEGKSINGGYGREQLAIIGVSWPPPKDWKKQVLNKKFYREQIKKFIDLTDKHIKFTSR